MMTNSSFQGYGNYAFGYNEDHATGGTFRKEKGGPGMVVGSYGLRDADGRVRVVNYIADALGYRATGKCVSLTIFNVIDHLLLLSEILVSSNEPGVDVKQDPAATNLNYGVGAHFASAPLGHFPVAHIAPLVHGYPAPVAYSVATSHSAPLLHYNSYADHGLY